MRTMKTLLINITIALLTACTSVHDVSNVSPFQTKIGAKTLIVNAFICKVDERGSFAKGLPKYRIIKNIIFIYIKFRHNTRRNCYNT